MKNIFSKKKKLLIFHHSGVYGGASASLIFLLQYLKNYYECTIVTPAGSVTEVLTKMNLNFITIIGLPQMNNNYWGSYTGFRSLIFIREFIYLVRFLFFMKEIKKIKPDIIHLNDITILPIGKIIKFFYPDIKIYCHIRSLQNKKNSLLKKIQEKFLTSAIVKFIVIDKDVYNSLGKTFRNKSEIIYNSFKQITKKVKFKDKKNIFYVGFVGNFTDSKGVSMILEAAKILKNKKIHFILVGPIVYNLSFLGKVYSILKLRINFSDLLIKNSKKINNIYFVGFREKLDNFYKKIDLIAFPSYLNAAGRPVLEAGINGIPSILALDKNIKNDLVKDNFNGLYCLSNNSKDFAEKISKIALNKRMYSKLSRNCLRISKGRFNINKNGKKTYELFEGKY
tara:strand:+ start:41342 stop:42526 length:1185 start_codon:yes stop_codon:yes gene_type:complete